VWAANPSHGVLIFRGIVYQPGLPDGIFGCFCPCVSTPGPCRYSEWGFTKANEVFAGRCVRATGTCAAFSHSNIHVTPVLDLHNVL